MTDPWCWQINANITGFLVDGKCDTIDMAYIHASVMGNDGMMLREMTMDILKRNFGDSPLDYNSRT